MKNLDKFIYWINERYAIHQRRRAGEAKPWSNDPVMQETYFCNVHRENDKTTMWIRTTHYVENNTAPELNMIIARFVNKPASLEDMGWPFHHWCEAEKKQFLETMSKKGAWGGAYIVSTNGRAMPKHDYIAWILDVSQDPIKRLAEQTTLEDAHKLLQEQVLGMGSFMAAQVVADLKNTSESLLWDAPDWWHWCAYGPGSLRGMAWVMGFDKVPPSRFNDLIAKLREEVDKQLNYKVIPKFCNQDLQNCLCEFDKYMRVLNKTGRSKRRYNGKT